MRLQNLSRKIYTVVVVFIEQAKLANYRAFEFRSLLRSSAAPPMHLPVDCGKNLADFTIALELLNIYWNSMSRWKMSQVICSASTTCPECRRQESRYKTDNRVRFVGSYSTEHSVKWTLYGHPISVLGSVGTFGPCWFLGNIKLYNSLIQF